MAVDIGIPDACAVVLLDAVFIGEVIEVKDDRQAQLKESIDFLIEQRRTGRVEYQSGECHGLILLKAQITQTMVA